MKNHSAHSAHFALVLAFVLLFALFGAAQTGCRAVMNIIEDITKVDPTVKPAGYPPDPDQKKLHEEYRIRPLDTIRYEAFMEPEITTTALVSKNGEIDVKLLNRVKVEGLTLPEVKEKLEKLYSKYYTNPSLSVYMLVYAPRMIYLEGYVNRTGPVGLSDAQMTLLQALSSAGVQPRGDRQNVRLTRVYETVDKDGKKKEEARTFYINYSNIARGFAPDLPLLEGDRIYIEDSLL